MTTSTKDARRLTGYRRDTTDTTDRHQSLYDDDMDYQHYHHHTDEEEDEEDEEDEEEEVYEEYDEDLDDGLEVQHTNNTNKVNDVNDDTGSELSIPDPNIDFDMVYALHTFAATVEGQASVVRGDALTLLDDSNSYWWLVKVLKTAEVGYIPAENIETPHERLARLNSHRNIELTRKDIQDAFPIPPSNKVKKTKRVTLAKGVQFQSQIIFGSSDDEDDFFEAEFEQWDERMRSDDSESGTDDGEDSDDPYNYYDDSRQSFQEQPPQQQHPTDMYSSYHKQDTIEYESDSDILNDGELSAGINLEDETIKISLTPSIARDDDDHHHRRGSDGSIQNKLKKAAKLEKLLGGSSPEPIQSIQSQQLQQQQQSPQQRRGSKDSNGSKEKKEKSGIRKFFSRSNSKDSNKKSKSKQDTNALERQLSGGSQYETASISSQSTMDYHHDRTSSMDSTQQVTTKLKIHAGNINHFMSPQGMVESYKFVPVYPSTTATELIHMALHDQQQLHDQEMTYHDYYLIVKTLGGDEFTLVPSDKPFEIFHSLTAHLNTPMPSLRKARRISQLMGSDNATHIGGPSKDASSTVNNTSEDEVQFYLLSKTKRIDDGEIQIKVSLFPSQLSNEITTTNKRVDKLVKIPTNILIKDAVTLLLEKFHILNGVVANHISSSDDDIKSLRLDPGSEQDIVKYHLALNKDGQEHLLDLEEKLLHVFSHDQMPPIHYRRNSNPDRTSITANITPPEKHEIYFILKCIESTGRKVEQRPHRLLRQDTPMPRQETTPTNGFTTDQPIPILTDEPISSSPNSNQQVLLPQLDDAIDTLNKPKQRQSESMLFSHDFGMNDLMVMIRGAALIQPVYQGGGEVTIRSEISDVFKDSQTRLDQLEKELDRLMSEAVKVYH